MGVAVHNDLGRKFAKPVVAIHWVSAILIFIVFPVGLLMGEMEPVDKMGLLKTHVILGNFVFILTILRGFLFFVLPGPPHLDTSSPVGNKMIIWVHNAFYFILIALAATGIATMLTGGYADALLANNPALIKDNDELLPLEVHETIAKIMAVLILMHIAGIVKHYLATKENALKRII